MSQTLTVMVAALLLAAVSAGLLKPLRSELLRPIFWVAILMGAAACSSVSALYGSMRHAGTGLTTSYGWPKPFYFHYLSESGIRTTGLELLYFAGNTLVYAAIVLTVWTMFRIMKP